MAERIALHTGQPEERIVADFDRDRWFTAEEARDYGFIDKVITGATQVPEGAGDGRMSCRDAPRIQRQGLIGVGGGAGTRLRPDVALALHDVRRAHLHALERAEGGPGESSDPG